jgi:hypothetical protein
VHFVSRLEYPPIQEQFKLDTELTGRLRNSYELRTKETEDSCSLRSDAILFGRSLAMFWKVEQFPS